jgi:hypothetical protein
MCIAEINKEIKLLESEMRSNVVILNDGEVLDL